jgi:hypothetical protein
MLLQRMLRASLLDPSLYREVGRDRMATGQAFAVMLIVIACTLVGALSLGVRWILEISTSLFMGWMFWTFIATLVATQLRSRVEFDEAIRSLGFAQAPGVLYLFLFAPGIGTLVPLIAWAWTTIASVIALREVMRVETKQAILAVVLTTAIVGAISMITGMTIGNLGMLFSRFGA